MDRVRGMSLNRLHGLQLLDVGGSVDAEQGILRGERHKGTSGRSCGTRLPVGVGPPASRAGRTALLGDSPWPDHGFVRQPIMGNDGGWLRAGQRRGADESCRF